MSLRGITKFVHLSCEEASRLASDSMDRELPRGERWALRLHTFLCGSCRRLLQQLRILRAAAEKMPESAQQQLHEALPRLSVERKRQIKQLLADDGSARQS